MVRLQRLWDEQEGQDLTEYAFLIVLVTLVAVSMVKGLANAVASVFVNLTANLSLGA